jgi:hypothetical protein
MRYRQTDDVLDITLPRLSPDSADQDGYTEASDAIEVQRDAYAATLEALADATDSDPLLAALAQATQQIVSAEADRRRLLAYARRFTAGRAYPRTVLGEACARTEGWVRTAFTEADAAEVARRLNTTPVRNDP